jgi:hypothetical protein
MVVRRMQHLSEEIVWWVVDWTGKVVSRMITFYQCCSNDFLYTITLFDIAQYQLHLTDNFKEE